MLFLRSSGHRPRLSDTLKNTTRVSFARDKQCGDDVKTILVSGLDLTKYFAMATYSNDSTHLVSNIAVSILMFASASVSLWERGKPKA